MAGLAPGVNGDQFLAAVCPGQGGECFPFLRLLLQWEWDLLTGGKGREVALCAGIHKPKPQLPFNPFPTGAV